MPNLLEEAARASEEVLVELTLVLAQMDHEGARGAHQSARVALVLCAQLVDGAQHGRQDEVLAILNVALVADVQRLLVVGLRAHVESLLELLHERANAVGVDAELVVEHGVGVVGRELDH